jgi:hypothetical protein
MSVDTYHCPCCRSTLLRSDAEGLFHSPVPDTCPECGKEAPLREAVLDPQAFVDFVPQAWPPPGWDSAVWVERPRD